MMTDPITDKKAPMTPATTQTLFIDVQPEIIRASKITRRRRRSGHLTPYAFICQTWTQGPERFKLDPSHHMPGPNI